MILANSITLGILTGVSIDHPLRALCETIDRLTLVVLVVDVLLTIMVKRAGVLRSGWDLFDIVVTAVSIVPVLQAFAALRTFRAVRLLRLLSFIPNGRATIDGLFVAMRSMTTTMIIIGVVYYIFVILFTSLFGDVDPVHFGTLGSTAISLYEVMVYYGADPEVMGKLTNDVPSSWLLFIPFVFITSYALLNMFIGIIAAALEMEMMKDDEGAAALVRLEAKVDTLTTRLDEALARLN